MSVLSLFPRFVRTFFHRDVVGHTLSTKLVRVTIASPQRFSRDERRRISSAVCNNNTKVLVRYNPLFRTYRSMLPRGKPQSQIIFLSPTKDPFARSGTGRLCHSCGRLILVYKRCRNMSRHIRRCLTSRLVSVKSCILAKKRLNTVIVSSTITHVIPNILKSTNDTTNSSFCRPVLRCPRCAGPISCHN